MAFSPLSDWLEDQVSALWDVGVCNKAKKPKKKNHKSAGSAFCNEADDMRKQRRSSAVQCAVTAQLISTFVFTTQLVQSILFL